MAAIFTAVDLSRLPAPAVVDALNYETILAAMLEDLQARDPAFDALLESEPAYKILEVAAYREMLVRQRVNEAARAVMLAYSAGADLDNLGALVGVARLVTDPGDSSAIPAIPPTYETDQDYRFRIQLSLAGYSTAGPEPAYIFHALSADGQVLDASATSPSPGNVLVTVLSREGDGTASQALQDTVDAAVSGKTVRPLTDYVTVQSAGILPFIVDAILFTYPGAGSEVVLAEAQAQVADYVEKMHRLGKDVNLSAIYGALHVEGVQRVELISPAASILVDDTQATYCTAISVNHGGTDE